MNKHDADDTERIEEGSVSDTKRIARNTIMLYFRQILIMLVSLYTVRVVLATLGTDDYGVYSVVAGVVTMFSFLSNTMATSSQRYFSYAMGKNDAEELRKMFSISVSIQIVLIILVLIVAETLGLWYVNNILVVAEGRLTAANWVYQAVIINFMFTIFTTPYMASIIAHENMNIYAYMSIIEAGLKLIIVFVLKLSPFDKLISYGFLLTAVSIINTSLYRGYCKRHYAECKFKFVWDKVLFREMLSFSGWNLFGSGASTVKTQGGTMIVNFFFGTAVNSAQGVATQVKNAILVFSNNFSTAVRPQLTKLYAAEKKKELVNLLGTSCKLMAFLTLIIVAPLYNNLEVILQIWLEDVPDYTVIFIQLLLMESLIESVSTPMATVNQATGKIKIYQLVIGTTLMFTLPITYILFTLGCEPYMLYVVNIVLMSIVAVVRLMFLLQAGVDILALIKNSIIPIIITCILSFVITHYIKIETQSFIVWTGNVLINVGITGILIWFVGFRKAERKQVLGIILNFFKKRKHA